MPSIAPSSTQQSSTLHDGAASEFTEAVHRAVVRHVGSAEFAVEAKPELSVDGDSAQFAAGLRARDGAKLALVVDAVDRAEAEAATARLEKVLSSKQAAVGVVLAVKVEHSTPPSVHLSIAVYTPPAPAGSLYMYSNPPYTLTCTAPDHGVIKKGGSSASSASSSNSSVRRLSPSPPAHLVFEGDTPTGEDAGLLPNLELPLEAFLKKGVQVRNGERAMVEGKAIRAIVTSMYDAAKAEGE